MLIKIGLYDDKTLSHEMSGNPLETVGADIFSLNNKPH